MQQIRGVILDMDGTLIDSNDAHAHSWLQAMLEAGFEPGYDKVRRLIGMGGDFLIPEALGIEAESATGKRISQRRKKIFRECFLPELKPFPRVRELVARFKEEGFALVVASASRREEVGRMLEISRIDDLVDDATSASEAEEPKPEPDILQGALEKIGLPPGEVLMLGDTPYDLEAGEKAGVRVVAVRCGGWPDEELSGALAVYDDAADLLENLDSSPFMQGRG